MKNYKSVLIQAADGDYTNLLRLTFDRHASYCRTFEYNYSLHVNETPLSSMYGMSAHWDKLLLIGEYARLGFQHIVWLDADTVISDFKDMRCVPEDSIGLVRHSNIGWKKYEGYHYNTGVIVINAMSETFRYKLCSYIDKCFDIGVECHNGISFYEQGAMLSLLQNDQYSGMLYEMDSRYNSTYGVNESPDPVISAWHGYRDKDIYAKMRQHLLDTERHC